MDAYPKIIPVAPSYLEHCMTETLPVKETKIIIVKKIPIISS